MGDEFDLAGGHFGVGEAGIAVADGAGDGDDVLGAGCFGLWRGPRGRWTLSRTTWVMPERSRRSRKMRSPWSRRRLTQPMSTAFFPASPIRRPPHM